MLAEGESAAPQLTGSAALLAKMRRSNAVSGAATPVPAELPARPPPRDGWDGTLLILHGGEAAAAVAASLAAQAQAAGLCAQVSSAERFRAAGLESERRVALFVVETVENAQPAEAAGALVRHFLRRRKEAVGGVSPLAGLLTFAVLGLGDTNLLLDRQTTTGKDCNQAGAALDGALKALGGRQLVPRCEANDAVGLDAAVQPWAAALWPALLAVKAGPAAAVTEAPATPLLVLYGSQTGNSAELARSLGAQAADRGLRGVRVVPMDAVSPSEVLRPGAVLLLVVSSTGDGEPPDNAAAFATKLRRLEREGGARAGAGVRYALLGLGDQNYSKFMAAPRLFSARLDALGCTPLAARGEADETEGLDEAVEKWTAALWPRLEAALAAAAAEAGSAPPGVPPALPAARVISPEEAALVGVPPLLPPRAALAWLSDEEVRVLTAAGAALDGRPQEGDGGEGGRYSAEAPLRAPLAVSTLLTAAGSDRRVVHAAFDITAATAAGRFAYQPGDSLGVLPENDPAEVAALLARLGVSDDRVFALDPPIGLPNLRGPMTAGAALARCVDVTAPVRRTALRLLAEHASAPEERLALLRLSSRGGRAEYETTVAGPRLSLLALLQRFPSCAPPFGVVLDAQPPLAPRLYSLTTAPEAAPSLPAVAFSVVPHGVATNWLARLPLGATVPLFLRPAGAFTPPADPGVPIIMVGPGTGVAPFRGFLQRRRAQRAAGATLGPSWLFFGCRNAEEDFLYRSELEALAAEGTLSHLVTAFSRPAGAPPDAPKVYVQHRLAEHGAALAALLTAQTPATVFVCGDGAGMAKGVHAALLALLEAHGGLSGEAAAAALADWAKSGRYVRDIWAAVAEE